MTNKPKGILDPWRRVEPLQPQKRSAPPSQTEERQRINIEDVDRDADLAIPGSYTIRTTHSSFHVVSVRVDTPKDALDVLADCVIEAWRIKPLGSALSVAGVGVRNRTYSYNVPVQNEQASTLKGGDATLWFVQKPLDQGMLILARILRMPEAAALCKKHGVTVML
jgi:hypothetical protein